MYNGTMLYVDRFGLQDASPESRKVLYDALRKRTPEQKVLMVFDRIEAMRQLRAATARLRERRSDYGSDRSGS
jgi:hypothetical protein